MKKELRIMSLLGIFAFLSLTIFVSDIFNEFNFNTKNRLENSGFWDLTSTPIHINDLNPSINWSRTAADNEWCSGSGTWSDPYLIENITIDDLFSGSCIWIENSEVPFIIRNCTFINSGRGAVWPDSGIRFNNVSNGRIENNTIYLNEFYGLSILDGSKNNTITKNNINNNDDGGLYLGYSSNNNIFSDNNFNYNYFGGFYIYHCNFNNFSGNTIKQTTSDQTREITITGQNNTFSGNMFENCGIYLQPWDEPLSELSSHLIDITNLVNGKPIYYYANKSFLIKDNFTNAGQVILVNCEFCEISSQNISNSGRGILFYYSHNNTIFNNSISNSFAEEISVYKSDQNNISHNLISNIGDSIGITLSYSNKNNVSLNQIFDCNTAIDINTGYWNTISFNNLTDNYRGVDIYHGELTDMNNTIKKNIISDNDQGIYVQNANTNGNTIFFNYFITNSINAYDNGDYNYWDNGSLGNYWDDYVGNDSNDDGIGETPYIVSGAGGNQDNFPLWDDGHNGSKIFIDDGSSNNWNWASKHTWCTGSGTLKDPYIIKNCNIDGNNSGSCIYIKNSNVYFRIENCTVYNSQSVDGIYHAGILLEDTSKGTIINTTTSYNNGNGISLDGSHNITIQGCFINDNINYGISQIWSSYNITIINNTINNNNRGIFTSSAAQDDKIIGNVFKSNTEAAIYFNPGSYSLIERNKITGSFRGIHLWGNNNTILFNDIYSNSYGIYFSPGMDTWNNTIAHNSIYNSFSYAIYLEGSNDRFNIFYNNSFTGNGNNAYDDGYGNYWDNGIIGNYWDDYSGEDANDDGIGEDPYVITGLALSQDNFPIWDDGHNGSKIVIDDSASNNWVWAKTRTWCSGSGTFNDPYIIRECIIDGNNLTSCIQISNSIVYFRIENCSIFNCSSGQAGIKLLNVLNGQLLNSNCSNNIGYGIYLSDSHNNTISGNIANYNDEFGIFLEASDNNTLSGNDLNENFYGIYLGLSNNNTISENSANNNDWQGIYLSSSSNNNTILNNNVTCNNDNGIFIDSSTYNKLFGNIADNNGWNGLLLWKSIGNIIRGNIISYNVFAGVYLYRSNNTEVIENNFIGNLYNIYEIGCENNNFVLNYYDGILTPFVIDNNGGGDLTWLEAVNLFVWCTGSGSYSDPYIIQNLIIDGQNSSSCIEIRDSDVYFYIINCSFYNSGNGLYNAGIELANVINGQLITNNCSNNNGIGIGLYQSQNVTIDGNIVNNNEESGIFLEVSHNNILSANTLNENSDGIYLGLSTNNTISENSAFNNDQRGIYLSSSSNNNTILNNNFTYNGQDGIFISYSYNNTIIGNNADYNDYGISVWNSNNNTIIGNTLSNNDFIGLWLYKSNNTDVICNTFFGNSNKNIKESETKNNFFNWNYLDGIFSPFIIDDDGGGDFTWTELKSLFFWCTGSGNYFDPYIINNLIINGKNSSSCIEIRDSMVFFKIEGFTLYNSSSGLSNAGIKLTNVVNGQLINNNCSNNNGNGIQLSNNQNVTIDGNIVNNNEEFGIFLEVSHNNTLSGNTLDENYGGILLVSSSNNTISENFAYNNGWQGFYLSSSSNNNIILNNNLTYNNENGIFVDSSNYNTITGNIADHNSENGIFVESSIYNTITGNIADHNSENGIFVEFSNYNTITGNIADHNGGNGIFVCECNDTTVARNKANYNTFAGLYLMSSNNTEVIGNIFIGNLYTISESDGVNNNFNWNVEDGFTDPIIIDDTGIGNFTWGESLNYLAWIYGSGTLIDPYIIELITIDGLNLTSCLTIRNSNVYFRIQNCTFYNSGYNLYDGGIKLNSTLNGELKNNNCSFNNANGIILDSCQSIVITENSINNNQRSGLVLIDCSNIDIINNKETINFNELYGIYLFNSHYNDITNNTINNNGIGIFLNQSNYNSIDWNTLLNNGQAIVDNGVGNIIGLNNVLPGTVSEFPFDILIIILIIGLVVVGVTGATIVIKKKRSIPAKKEKELSEKKKEKIRIKLEGKLDFVDYLIRERNIKLAYKNLGKIQDTADLYDFFDIFNKANERVDHCKEIEASISKAVIEEEVSRHVKEREVKEVVIPPPIIKKEEEKKYNLFISYSTVDRDYFQISKIVEELKKYPNISQISYWERDSKANIVEFMDETLEVSNTFLLFCSEHSVNSKAVKDEWQAAFQMRKEGLIKLIPVYEEQKHIPKILWHLLNVKYDKDNFKSFIENLYKEIMRE